jgi:hypothetical protein
MHVRIIGIGAGHILLLIGETIPVQILARSRSRIPRRHVVAQQIGLVSRRRLVGSNDDVVDVGPAIRAGLRRPQAEITGRAKPERRSGGSVSTVAEPVSMVLSVTQPLDKLVLIWTETCGALLVLSLPYMAYHREMTVDAVRERRTGCRT